MTAVDRNLVRRWLDIYSSAPGHFTLSVRNRNFTGPTWETHGDLDAAADQIAELAATTDVWLRVTTLRQPPAGGKRGERDDTQALIGFWADIDTQGPGHKNTDYPPTTSDALLILDGLPDPTTIFHSGGGLQVWWLFDPPWVLNTPEDLDAAATAAEQWTGLLQTNAAEHGWTVDSTGDLARILRPPGTLNHKPEYLEAYQQPLPVTVHTQTRRRYQVDTLLAIIDAHNDRVDTELENMADGARRPTNSSDDTVIDDWAATSDWADLLTPHGWQLAQTSRNGTRYWTRPGKTTKEGWSAISDGKAEHVLVQFSSNANLPVSSRKTKLTKFRVYAELNHSGDTKAAYAAIAPDKPRRTTPSPRDTDGQPRPEFDVTNSALAAERLREDVGRGPLAGMFNRAGEVVHTPREGEDGYIPPDDTVDHDGPAQIHAVTPNSLASRLTYTYDCFKTNKDGDRKPALFPAIAARVPVDVPDLLPNLRPLRAAIHTPIVRRDGTILVTPGYDTASRLLYLPAPDLDVPPVAENPSRTQTADAVSVIDKMLTDFRFVSDHDRANYIGLLLTPLLRELAPPPYKLGAITAPQPGSGKTLLATILRTTHGGVFRAEIPNEEAELRKQVTAILDVTTGPVIHFDNVTGVLRSSTLAGLLTSGRWDDRKLGATEMISRPNDRLWIVTGNNVAIGGDLARRTIGVTIDPGVPNPHLRTGFKIPNLEQWVDQHRGDIIGALLTLVTSWVANGKKITRKGSDGYARWVATITAILDHAGIPGQFDAADISSHTVGVDDDDWYDLLHAAYEVFGSESWTVRELLDHVDIADLGPIISGKKIPLEALPADLAEKAVRSKAGPAACAKSLGRWLMNRDGRWAVNLTVRNVGVSRTKSRQWRVDTAEGQPSDQKSAGFAGFAGFDSGHTRMRKTKTSGKAPPKNAHGSVEIKPGKPANPAKPTTTPPTTHSDIPTVTSTPTGEPCTYCGNPCYALTDGRRLHAFCARREGQPA